MDTFNMITCHVRQLKSSQTHFLKETNANSQSSFGTFTSSCSHISYCYFSVTTLLLCSKIKIKPFKSNIKVADLFDESFLFTYVKSLRGYPGYLYINECTKKSFLVLLLLQLPLILCLSVCSGSSSGIIPAGYVGYDRQGEAWPRAPHARGGQHALQTKQS